MVEAVSNDMSKPVTPITNEVTQALDKAGIKTKPRYKKFDMYEVIGTFFQISLKTNSDRKDGVVLKFDEEKFEFEMLSPENKWDFVIKRKSDNKIFFWADSDDILYVRSGIERRRIKAELTNQMQGVDPDEMAAVLKNDNDIR